MDEAQPRSSPPKLSRPVVVALDAARAAAAVYVMLYHLASARSLEGGLRLALGFGQEAVMVFFVLSGFVIFANESHRAGTPWGYFGRRLRRLIPPLLVALLVSTAVALGDGTFGSQFSWRDLLGTLTFVEDIAYLKPGVLADPYLHNNPLWSLSYEMAFYLLFPIVMVGWRRWPRATCHSIGASACLAYAVFSWFPNHWALVWAYFLAWWAGAMAAQAYLSGRKTLSALLQPLAWLGGLCAVAAVVVIATKPLPPLGFYPILPLRHFATALVLLAALYGPAGAVLAKALARLPRFLGFASSISYGLYVLHYPLLIQWSVSNSLAGFLLAVSVLLVGSILIDRELTLWLRRRKRA